MLFVVRWREALVSYATVEKCLDVSPEVAKVWFCLHILVFSQVTLLNNCRSVLIFGGRRAGAAGGRTDSWFMNATEYAKTNIQCFAESREISVIVLYTTHLGKFYSWLGSRIQRSWAWSSHPCAWHLLTLCRKSRVFSGYFDLTGHSCRLTGREIKTLRNTASNSESFTLPPCTWYNIL